MKNKYDILLCDPPWQYDNKKTGGTHKSGSSQKYHTWGIVEIQNLSGWLHFEQLLNKDCVLFLWTTNSMLPHAVAALELWEFEFKTMITWVKKSYGLGYWYRGKTEHILMGIKGKVKPFKFNLPNVIFSNTVLPHSVKPEKSYEMIEMVRNKITNNTGKQANVLELFARRNRKQYGWTCIGKEISGNDIIYDVENLLGLNSIKLNQGL